MVDVGYIYASAGELLFSASSRREYRVDADKLIQALIKQADDQVRGQLLRVYWYDAARDRVPTFDQRVIAQMPLVKLRLGNLNARGQQKGVDAQIRADMEALARHRAITDAILVAGDEDMVPAVEAARRSASGSTSGASSPRTGRTRPSAWSGSRTRSRYSSARSSSPTSSGSLRPSPPPRAAGRPGPAWAGSARRCWAMGRSVTEGPARPGPPRRRPRRCSATGTDRARPRRPSPRSARGGPGRARGTGRPGAGRRTERA